VIKTIDTTMIYTFDSFIMINLKLFKKFDSFQYIPNCMQMLVTLEHFAPFAPPPWVHGWSPWSSFCSIKLPLSCSIVFISLYTFCSLCQNNKLLKKQQHVTTFGKKITSNSIFPLNSLNIHFKISNAFSITYCPCLRFLLSNILRIMWSCESTLKSVMSWNKKGKTLSPKR